MRIVFGDVARPRKKNKKKLFFALICAELLGILVLVWFLRAPLYQKFLAQPPKAYDSSKMLSTKQYLVSQNDQIAGKAAPNSKVKFYLSPLKQISSSRTDSQGVWIYQIPKDLPAGKYQLYVALFGNSKEILIKNYHFRVIPRGILAKTILGFNINSTVFAQEDTDIISEILSEDPVVDPLFQDSAPATDCPETGCAEPGLELITQPVECDPTTVGYMIVINPETSEAESLLDESGLCGDPELGDAGYFPIFYRIPDYPSDKATRRATAYCPSEEMIDQNKKPGSCRLFNTAIDIFDTNFTDEQREVFVGAYSSKFIGKEVFMDYLVNFDKSEQDFLNEGRIIKDDKYGKEVYVIGDEEEFRRRMNYIIEKAQYAGFNPAIFLSYWLAESDLSTSWAADLGCDPYTKRANFEKEVNCALGLNRNGEIPAFDDQFGGSYGPRCARSNDAYSKECEATPRLTIDDKPIDEFETLFIPHADFSKASLPTSSGDCTHSYNETLRTIINIGAYGDSAQRNRYFGR